MPRWNDYQYPAGYIECNPSLFEHYGKHWDAGMAAEDGYITQSWHGNELPDGYYFPPQRESRPDLALATNHFITPGMRLCMMKQWTNIVSAGKLADIQWRYDELNRQLLAAYGSIDEAKAWELIDFLSPGRQFPAYYGSNPVIEGSVSLCNLTDRTMKSHYGYHVDDPAILTLPRYV